MEELIFVNQYKEPLKPIIGGFGYMGTIMGTEDGVLIQCHMCGKLFQRLHMHIRQAHDVDIKKYRAEYGLSPQTSLISNKERNRMIETMLKIMKKNNWTHQSHVNFGKLGAKARKPGQPKITLETLNERGTCPEQLLAQLKKVADKLKHTPTKKEFEKHTGSQKYKHLIYTTFGSYNQAIKMLNLIPNPATPRYTDEELLEYLKNFMELNHRKPTRSDFNTEILPAKITYKRHFHSLKRAYELI